MLLIHVKEDVMKKIKIANFSHFDYVEIGGTT